MTSQKTQEIAQLYEERHKTRTDVFGDRPYANYGYWVREDIPIDEACDAMTDLVARASGLTEGDRVLEVGCGYGASAVYYAGKFKPSSVVGVDVTEVRLKSGREYVKRCGLDGVIDIRLGDATALEFPDASFDRIIGIECAFHFDTRLDFLKEACRVLAPGGGLALADLILREGADAEAFIKASRVDNYGRSLVAQNVHDRRIYLEQLVEAGFTEASVEVITERTLVPLITHLEKVAAQQAGEKAAFRARSAAIVRHFLKMGMEYVLVSARKPAA
ncbi:MAG: methyltransferase domain-containing protein [Deltaproteobacteria bacterium]|nr:methyltransferase domain-containing protein [Deltaproteobacteria bacterium]